MEKNINFDSLKSHLEETYGGHLHTHSHIYESNDGRSYICTDEDGTVIFYVDEDGNYLSADEMPIKNINELIKKGE